MQQEQVARKTSGKRIMQTREMVLGAILMSLSLVIPLAFGGVLTVTIPPFTATLAAHVPVMLAMLVSPLTAVMVGIGSMLGFLIRLGMPVVAARALMHSLFGGVGAVLIRRGMPFWAALLAVLPVHALSEALIVIPFGFSLYQVGVVVAVGTALHHLVDAGISLTIAPLIRRAGYFGGPGER
ncbi:MAG: ECF transporter S component [Syntrophothermus sp.]